MRVVLAMVAAVLLAAGLLKLTAAGGEGTIEAATPATVWVSPYFFDDSGIGMYSLVSVLNADSMDVTVTSSFFDTSGSLVGADVQLVAPNATHVFSTASGLSNQVTVMVDAEGWIKNEATGNVLPSGFLALSATGDLTMSGLTFYNP